MTTDDRAAATPTENDVYFSFRNSLGAGDFDWTLAEAGERAGINEPPIVAIARLVADRAEHRPRAHERLGAYFKTLSVRAGARVVVSSLTEGPGPRYQTFERQFALTGEIAPAVSNELIYFGSNGLADINATFSAAQAIDACAVLHCVAYVHSAAADHFFISVLDARKDGEESIRLGTGTISAVRDGFSWDMAGRLPRLYSLAVGGGYFSLYIDGALMWRRRRTHAQHPVGAAFRLLTKSTPGASDGAVFEYELWSMPTPFEGFDPRELERLGELTGKLARGSETLQLYRLLSSVDNMTAGSHETAIVDAMADLAHRGKGYPEWLFDRLQSALSPDGRKAWHAREETLKPTAIVEVSDVSIRFSRNPSADLSAWRRIRGQTARSFSVLSGIGFRVFPGDVVGIIGHNGAGKSTLLRALAGVVPINTGRIMVRGKQMLLRGGLGLRLELSGRENIVSLGIYLGLSHQRIKALVDEVIEFAELADHMDKPVKYYSDGMLSRLVFSTATSVSPEILMLDELLGAGDIKFQSKAQARLRQFIQGSRAVIVVTHSVGFVREQCNKAIVLSEGRQIFSGEPSEAVACYLAERQLSGVSLKDIEGEPHL